VTDAAGTASFNRRDNRIDGAAAVLPRLHLNYEMVGDWRLHSQDVRSPLLIVEHPKRLAPKDVAALVTHVRNGRRLLLSGMGLHLGRDLPLHEVFGLSPGAGPSEAERLVANVGHAEMPFEHHLFRVRLTTAEPLITVTDSADARQPRLTRNRFGRGTAYYFATPLLCAHGKNAVPLALMREVFELTAPSDERELRIEAPETVEVALRARGPDRILHLVNMAPGRRRALKSGGRQYVTVDSLPPVPACRVSILANAPPSGVYLQPQDKKLEGWRYADGRIEVLIPEFDVHQIVVFASGD
jgi:hypothetical protein